VLQRGGEFPLFRAGCGRVLVGGRGDSGVMRPHEQRGVVDQVPGLAHRLGRRVQYVQNVARQSSSMLPWCSHKRSLHAQAATCCAEMALAGVRRGVRRSLSWVSMISASLMSVLFSKATPHS